MGTLVAIVVGGLVAWASARLAIQRQEARLSSWRRAVADAGLEAVEERERFFGHEIAARAGTLAVQLERFKRGRGRSGTRVTISGLGHGPFGLSFRREGLGTRLDRVLSGEGDVETGDVAFDREVFVSGEPTLAHAVLDAEARRAVRWLLAGRVALPDGSSVDADVHVASDRITVEIAESVFDDPRHPVVSGGLLRSLLEAARRLSAPKDRAAAIASIAASDRSPGVRLACVRRLVDGFPRNPATRPLLLAACHDDSLPVRLEAALALGEEGVATLIDVARAESAEDALRARAIGGLGEALPLDLAEATIREAASDGAGDRRASAIASIRAISQRGPSAVAALTRGLASPDVSIATAAVRALGLAGPVAEAPLVAVLSREEPAMRVAAADSLGRVGSVDAVAALHESLRRSDAGGMRRAVRQAVAAIQARLSGAEPGQLTLAAGGHGQLSLADDVVPDGAGDVSLFDADLVPADRAEPEAEPTRPQRPGTIHGKT
jgi:HEAT repeat protein